MLALNAVQTMAEPERTKPPAAAVRSPAIAAPATISPEMQARTGRENVAPPIKPGPQTQAAATLPQHPERERMLPTNHKTFDITLVDVRQQPFRPCAVLQARDKVCFLGTNCLWVAAAALKSFSGPARLSAQRYDLSGNAIGGVPVQEFNDFVYSSPDNSLVIVDKAGDLFLFSLDSRTWGVFRSNVPFLAGEPDPDFIDLANVQERIIVLDPERNELWRVKAKTKKPDELFRQVLPWRVKRGDIYVGDGIALAYDGDLYVLKRSGYITRFAIIEPGPAGPANSHAVPPLSRLPALQDCHCRWCAPLCCGARKQSCHRLQQIDGQGRSISVSSAFGPARSLSYS